MRFTKARRLSAAVAVMGVLAMLLAGCSSGSPEAATSGPPSSGGAMAGFPSLAELYKGTSAEPPSDGPAAAKGKSVWVVNCGSPCNSGAGAVKEAAKALGWNYNYADGNLNIAGGYATAIRTALASRPDALYIQGFSCTVVQQPLQEAKDQGVPVISVDGVNCNGADGTPLFTVPNAINKSVGDNIEEFWKDDGRRAAWYLIAATNGNLKAISTDGPDPLEHAIAMGFQEEVAKCSGCKILQSINSPGTDLIPNGPWIQNFRTSLITNADANGVFLPFDFMYGTLGGAAAMNEAGSKATMAGGLGIAEATDLVSSGKLTWPGAADDTFKGWAAMDNLNRYFNGVPAAPQGVGQAAVNTDNPGAIPAAGKPYQVPFDYKAIYRSVWAGKK